jgi:hypothetical protein
MQPLLYGQLAPWDAGNRVETTRRPLDDGGEHEVLLWRRP